MLGRAGKAPSPAAFAGKIVIVGSSAKSLNDLFYTPLSATLDEQRMVGSELQGAIVSQLRHHAEGVSRLLAPVLTVFRPVASVMLPPALTSAEINPALLMSPASRRTTPFISVMRSARISPVLLITPAANWPAARALISTRPSGASTRC